MWFYCTQPERCSDNEVYYNISSEFGVLSARRMSVRRMSFRQRSLRQMSLCRRSCTSWTIAYSLPVLTLSFRRIRKHECSRWNLESLVMVSLRVVELGWELVLVKELNWVNGALSPGSEGPLRAWHGVLVKWSTNYTYSCVWSSRMLYGIQNWHSAIWYLAKKQHCRRNDIRWTDSRWNGIRRFDIHRNYI